MTLARILEDFAKGKLKKHKFILIGEQSFQIHIKVIKTTKGKYMKCDKYFWETNTRETMWRISQSDLTTFGYIPTD